jgi:CzcA family heavy metal efflux pump
MLAALIRFSVRHPGIVVGLALALMAYGALRLFSAPLDVFPEFAPPQVSIQTEAPGFAPDQVEVLVTRPIEDVINGVPGVQQVRSQSIQGLSVITAVLEPGADLFRARQSLAERMVELVPRLPKGLPPPVISPLTSSSSTVLVVGFTSDRLTPMEQRTIVDWVVRPRLLATPGVAKVASFGGEVRQLQVQVDPVRLTAHGVGVNEVVEAASRATGIRGGGVLEGANQRITVEALAPSVDTATLGAIVLRQEGGAVLRIRDVADVVEAGAPRFGDGAVDGKPGIVTVVSAQLGGNTKVVAQAAEEALETLRPALERQGLELDAELFRPATFIDLALRNITTSLLLGAVLVAVVLLLFLGDVRSAAISLTAIPLSLLSATLLLELLGFSINTLTLGGLAIALGEVVDDAIIDVENIARRLRAARTEEGSESGTEELIVSASMEVRGSVVYATFVVALVFLPVLGLSGVQGALFRPLALAYIFATLASLIVALTVTPALARLLIAGRSATTSESRVLQRLKEWYGRLLDRLFGEPGLVVGLTALVGIGALLTLPFFGATFLPEFREGHFLIHMSAVPGTSLEENMRLGRIVTGRLKEDPRVRSVAQRAGRAELSEDTWGTHYTEFEVDLVPLSGDAAETIQDDLRDRLQGIPGVNFAIRGFLAERIEETLTGSTAQVVVKVFGDDLDSLDVAARDVAELIAGLPGAEDVQYDPPAVAPTVSVRLRPERLATLGLRPDEVLETLETATRGRVVAQAVEGGRSTDIVVIAAPARREQPEQLGALPVATPDGRIVPLRAVSDVQRTTRRYAIAHQGTRRVQTVTANVEGRDIGGFNNELRAALTDTPLPVGVHAEVGGAAEAQRTAQRELLVNAMLAAVGILVLLWLAFGRADRLVLVLVNLPLALVGGVLAVFASGGVLSLGSLVGFVTLFGIATRNAVMLLSHYDHLVTVEHAPWNLDTARRGALERLGPILMTALVTAIGLLPLALGSGDPGREVEGPMAIVILGGLLTSTLLSLVVLPILALAFLRWDRAAVPR